LTAWLLPYALQRPFLTPRLWTTREGWQPDAYSL
jgi:hypothetical protein